MSNQQFDSIPTSNDLLESRVAENTSAALNYQIVAQSAEDVQNIENAPAVSMEPYLFESGQRSLLTTISIYSLRGESREQMRLLYMNSAAIRIWEEMGRPLRSLARKFAHPTQLSSRLVSLSAS